MRDGQNNEIESADGVENPPYGPTEENKSVKFSALPDDDWKVKLKHTGVLCCFLGFKVTVPYIFYYYLCPITFRNVSTFSKVMGHCPDFLAEHLTLF